MNDKDEEIVSLKHLAKMLGMDRSHARRWLLKQGIRPQKRRTADAGGALALSFTSSEAERVLALRRQHGFAENSPLPTKGTAQDEGFFYVVQLVPDLAPGRVKLGFACDVDERLTQHRTAAPTATVARVWPCWRGWELTAIAALTAVGCRLILSEVFECDDPAALLGRGDAFFAFLPAPGWLPPLADCSPLRDAAQH